MLTIDRVTGRRNNLFAACLIVVFFSARSPGQELQIRDASKPPRKLYSKLTSFHLPIQVSDATRTRYSAYQLYVRIGEAPWILQDSKPADASHFTYRVAADGEYKFSLATIDNSGNSEPKEFTNNSPALLHVVVDTKAPTIEATIDSERGTYLRVKIIDQNADLNSLKAMAILESGVVHFLKRDGLGTSFRLTQEQLRAVIRVSVSDLSGNTSIKDIEPKAKP